MISVLLSWIYIVVTAFLVGFAVCSMIGRLLGYRVRDPVSITGTGLVTVTVYAQVFSLFYKVGAAANLLLVLACAGVMASDWRGAQCVMAPEGGCVEAYHGGQHCGMVFLYFQRIYAL